MEKLQGDMVLVEMSGASEQFILTIIHVVDVSGHSLLLVNRQDKTKASWELTQAVLDNMVKFHHPKEPLIKWKLVV
jgi:hypothetical protein